MNKFPLPALSPANPTNGAKKTKSSSETTNGGARANSSGNTLERFVESTLIDQGYTFLWDHRKQMFENRDALGGKQYGKHIHVGKTIYDTNRIVDFLIVNKDLFPEGLILECKWQQVGGSVDEKYPFLMFNIARTAVPTIVLLDGGGYKPSAKTWLASNAGAERALRAVWSMSEFQRAVNDGLLG